MECLRALMEIMDHEEKMVHQMRFRSTGLQAGGDTEEKEASPWPITDH